MFKITAEFTPGQPSTREAADATDAAFWRDLLIGAGVKPVVELDGRVLTEDELMALGDY